MIAIYKGCYCTVHMHTDLRAGLCWWHRPIGYGSSVWATKAQQTDLQHVCVGCNSTRRLIYSMSVGAVTANMPSDLWHVCVDCNSTHALWSTACLCGLQQHTCIVVYSMSLWTATAHMHCDLQHVSVDCNSTHALWSTAYLCELQQQYAD